MDKGLYEKYDLRYVGGDKRVEGRYFLLKPDVDIHAAKAIAYYAESCRKDNPELAIDLLIWAWNALQDTTDE